MIKYLQEEEWRIVELGFDPVHHCSSESIFSLGNGKFGQRAGFEEDYSGKSLQGHYVAGVYYPDKTRVGWWKNGYPEYFAKVLNSTNWTGLSIEIDGESVDLAKSKISIFSRILDMQRGVLERSFDLTLNSGKKLKLSFRRFCSMQDDETAAIELKITAESSDHRVKIKSYLDADVRNEDSNYDEGFWNQQASAASKQTGWVHSQTKKTAFDVAVAMQLNISPVAELKYSHKEAYAEISSEFELRAKETVCIHKYIGLVNSQDYISEKVVSAALEAANRIASKGFETALKEQELTWAKIWETGDIIIEGDVAAQQAIRFNIFHLNQTYTGKDERLNIGPKGFTGEKYGGSTYWDTEAYCLPFYLSTHDSKIARQLLVYRYNHLQKAIENAEKLGFTDGAALYPMVTMNGEECHNEWEITFEEIHRNGAIAFAIFNYIRHTGDQDYLSETGIDVLVGIARFWAQRATWSDPKQAWVILGVTGPNEYENNINNNWYTNYIAAWSLKYAAESCEWLKTNHPDIWKQKAASLKLNESSDIAAWYEVAGGMYFPKMENSSIFLQQDGFLDKEQRLAADLDPKERPINQHWSWDRILRSVFIKQADTLQGMYLFEDDFKIEELKANFDFYEPMTVHESSLSPCVHSILAAKLGYEEKAYEMYLRTSRLDLDDYNHEAHEGLHITSMAGTWMSVVEGFGGMRVIDGELHFNPMLPSKWTSYSFTVLFRNKRLQVQVSEEGVQVSNHGKESIRLNILGEELVALSKGAVRVPLN